MDKGINILLLPECQLERLLRFFVSLLFPFCSALYTKGFIPYDGMLKAFYGCTHRHSCF